MKLKKPYLIIMLISLAALVFTGCGITAGLTSTSIDSTSDGQITRPEGWTDETHSNSAEPNYEVVFPEDRVNQIKITVSPEDWEVMQENMAELFGASDTGQAAPGGLRPDGDVPPDMGDSAPDTDNMTQELMPRRGGVRPGGMVPPDMGAPVPGTDNITQGVLPGQEGSQVVNPRAPGIPGWINIGRDNPDWVPATIEFNGLIWTNVGLRYKGNSSLNSGWKKGSLKLPMKLDFDEFEDECPEIDNQRFYGFKQLSFSNLFSDGTYMHDPLTSDILQEAGLMAAETAWYEATIDYGEGPVNLGLYVVIEIVDDTVIDRYFDDDSGNIYEGDGPGVSLAVGTRNQIQSSFQKENNEDEADWSDIEKLYDVLHSESRISEPESWRESLEAVFDVDSFLEWLSISAIIQHWDTYGQMSHNFYLYNDPDTGMLNWISWDHNQILSGGTPIGLQAGRAAARIRTRSSLSLGMEEVTQQWPLIRYLLDDPVYHDRYIKYIEETINGPLDPDKLAEKCRKTAEILAPYVATDDFSEIVFESTVDDLIYRIYERYKAAVDFLESER
jgi:spore coat protein H